MDCRHASGGVDRCCAWFLVSGRWRAWRNVHRGRNPGRALPWEHPEWACWGWADAGGGGASLPPTSGGMGGSSEPAWVEAAALAAPPPIPQRGFPSRSRIFGKGGGEGLLLLGTGQVLQYRVLSRTYLCWRVICAVSGPWGGTCALQRAEHAMESQLLAAKHHGRDMFGWLSAAERFHTLHEHEMDAYDADHHFSLVPQRGKSARNSAFGCWSCPNPNLNPKP
jgi:hypothetical protein